jgi:ABC-type branched-subunit amino acid transport system ATPase component
MRDMFQTFPVLKERADTPAGVLSGGEQQILTICRTLMGDPDLIMIYEPTEGLSPMMVEHVAALLEEIVKCGVSILLVEQKLTIALKISARLYVIGHGTAVSSSAASLCASLPNCSFEQKVVAAPRPPPGFCANLPRLTFPNPMAAKAARMKCGLR